MSWISMKPPRISTRDEEELFTRKKTKSYNRRNSSFLRATFFINRIEDPHSFKITIIFNFLKPSVIIKIKGDKSSYHKFSQQIIFSIVSDNKDWTIFVIAAIV